MIGRWSELPIGTASLQDVFADHLLPQREVPGAVSLPVNTVWIPSAFHWSIFSLFRKEAGSGCDGDELVDPGSWQFVDSHVRFCWMLVHFSRFQWLSRVEVFGPVLYFWWNPLEHTLHLTGTVLERQAAEHLAHFSLEPLALARGKPWFNRDFNEIWKWWWSKWCWRKWCWSN